MRHPQMQETDVQSALLAAASGANAAFFVNHSLVADEVAAVVGAAA